MSEEDKFYMIDITKSALELANKNKSMIANIYAYIGMEINRKRIYQFREFIDKYCKEGDVSLDIGVGPGALSAEAGKRGLNISGLDIDPFGIIASTHYIMNILGYFYKIHIGDICTCLIPTWYYDLIICGQVLEHLKDEDTALKRIYDGLKHKGILILDVPLESEDKFKFIDPPRKITFNVAGAGIFEFESFGHINRYSSYEDVAKKLDKYGFKILEHRFIEGKDQYNNDWKVIMVVAQKTEE